MHFFFKDTRCPIRLKLLYGLETIKSLFVLFFKFINIPDQRIIKNFTYKIPYLLIKEIRIPKSIAEYEKLIKTNTTKYHLLVNYPILYY